MIQVEFHPEAQSELEDIHSWYRERSQIAATAFVGDVVHAIQRIIDSPESGSAKRGNERRLLFRRFPYSVIYRIRRDEIFVTAIAHQRRRPGYWRNRT